MDPVNLTWEVCSQTSTFFKVSLSTSFDASGRSTTPIFDAWWMSWWIKLTIFWVVFIPQQKLFVLKEVGWEGAQKILKFKLEKRFSLLQQGWKLWRDWRNESFDLKHFFWFITWGLEATSSSIQSRSCTSVAGKGHLIPLRAPHGPLVIGKQSFDILGI